MQHQRRIVAEPPRRVLVLGGPGAGKGRLAGLLAERFGLPVVSLEQERADFDADPARRTETPGARAVAWRSPVGTAAAEDLWVMTEQRGDVFDVAVPRADWLVFLNIPMSVCLVRVIRRILRRRGPEPEDQGPASWGDLRAIWAFPTDVVPRILGAIDRERRNRTIFILHSGRDVSGFITRLGVADKPDAGLASGKGSG